MHSVYPVARCFVQLTHASQLDSQSDEFAALVASLRIGEKILRLRRAEGVRSQCIVVAMPLPAGG